MEMTLEQSSWPSIEVFIAFIRDFRKLYSLHSLLVTTHFKSVRHVFTIEANSTNGIWKACQTRDGKDGKWKAIGDHGERKKRRATQNFRNGNQRSSYGNLNLKCLVEVKYLSSPLLLTISIWSLHSSKLCSGLQLHQTVNRKWDVFVIYHNYYTHIHISSISFCCRHNRGNRRLSIGKFLFNLHLA